jgi:hypothetical protein
MLLPQLAGLRRAIAIMLARGQICGHEHFLNPLDAYLIPRVGRWCNARNLLPGSLG